MLGMRPWRQAVIWGCLAWFSNCPWNDVRTDAIPLEFGMTPDVVATALGVPLVHVSGGAGNEVYYAERSTQIPSLFTYDQHAVAAVPQRQADRLEKRREARRAVVSA